MPSEFTGDTKFVLLANILGISEQGIDSTEVIVNPVCSPVLLCKKLWKLHNRSRKKGIKYIPLLRIPLYNLKDIKII